MPGRDLAAQLVVMAALVMCNRLVVLGQTRQVAGRDSQQAIVNGHVLL